MVLKRVMMDMQANGVVVLIVMEFYLDMYVKEVIVLQRLLVLKQDTVIVLTVFQCVEMVSFKVKKYVIQALT